ncbi:alcohol dehydrogenase [Xylariaceae sp. FL1019]|nr:alcohol dehydrogenase [Xylariaceae sp. FL1019]
MSTTETEPTVTQSKGQYLHGAKDLRLETRTLPAPTDDEVQVAIRSTTLCGSDLHYYSHYANGDILVREPLCLGHESAGEIVNLGASVSSSHPDLKLGDVVALEVGVPCGDCSFCQRKRYNICSSLRFRSSGSKFPHYQGTLQERLNHPAAWVYKISPELDCETGAMLEPLSVAVQAVRRVPDPPSPSAEGAGTCLIFGAGAVGLMCSVAARASGCYSQIVIADIDGQRLQFARENGFADAIFAVKPRRGATVDEKLGIAKDTALEIAGTEWEDGSTVGRVDTTFECTGVESCIQASIYSTKAGGAIVLVGLGVPNHVIPISEMMKGEVSLVPSWRYAHTYPRAIEIAKASVAGEELDGIKLPDIRKLITHRFTGIDSVEDAMKTAGKTSDDKGLLVVKTVINLE